MKSTFLFLFVLSLPVCAQVSPLPPISPEIPDDAVVASAGDKKLTAGDVRALVASMPAGLQQNFLISPKDFLRQMLVLRHLSELAEKAGLDKRSPYKELLEQQRRQILYQAQINEAQMQMEIPPEDLKKFYEENKERYRNAEVKMIQIPYSLTPPPSSDPNAKKVLTEAEAKAKAESLVRQIRAGADFVKLVKEHSGDSASASRNGEAGSIGPEDNSVPTDIKKAVLALKVGQVTDPIKQPNGYYIYRVESIEYSQFGVMQQHILQELRQTRFTEWIRSIDKSFEIKIENEKFFPPPRTPAGAIPTR